MNIFYDTIIFNSNEPYTQCGLGYDIRLSSKRFKRSELGRVPAASRHKGAPARREDAAGQVDLKEA